MITSKNYTVKFKDYGEITVPKGTRVSSETAIGYDPKYNFVAEFRWVDKSYPTVSNILKRDLETYGLDVPEEYLYKIDEKDLNKDEYIFGNKGSVWSDEIHIGVSGTSTTICGTPMLSSNWASIEKIKHASCPRCLDKRKENV